MHCDYICTNHYDWESLDKKYTILSADLLNKSTIVQKSAYVNTVFQMMADTYTISSTL